MSDLIWDDVNFMVFELGNFVKRINPLTKQVEYEKYGQKSTNNCDMVVNLTMLKCHKMERYYLEKRCSSAVRKLYLFVRFLV